MGVHAALISISTKFRLTAEVNTRDSHQLGTSTTVERKTGPNLLRVQRFPVSNSSCLTTRNSIAIYLESNRILTCAFGELSKSFE